MFFYKYKFFIIIMLILTILAIDNIKAAKDNRVLKGKIITLDPGHGGRDPGSMYGNIKESELNLQISNVLKKELEAKGATVYLTREKDEDFSSAYDPNKKHGDLWRRILKIQDNKSDIYLSIHLNSYRGSSESGAEVLYHPIHKNNKILGEIMIESFKEDYNDTRRLLKTDLYLYRNISKVPGILIECGFLSTAYDRKLLQTEEFQKRISKTITKGTILYFDKIKSQKD